MSSTTAKVYLQLWLSEQIPIGEWKRILEERKDVKELYKKHLERNNNESPATNNAWGKCEMKGWKETELIKMKAYK